MKCEFPSQFKEIIEDSLSRFNNELMLKIEVIRLAELEVEKKDIGNHLKSILTVEMLNGIQKQIFIEKEQNYIKTH